MVRRTRSSSFIQFSVLGSQFSVSLQPTDYCLLITVNYLAFLFSSYTVNQSLGDPSDGGTPGYIPNPAVKTVSADGTWGATPWESRSSPRDSSFLNSLSNFIEKTTGNHQLSVLPF